MGPELQQICAGRRDRDKRATYVRIWGEGSSKSTGGSRQTRIMKAIRSCSMALLLNGHRLAGWYQAVIRLADKMGNYCDKEKCED